MKKQLFIAMALLSLGVTSCKDDVTFDQDTYDNLIKEAFPVKNVDPTHQWTTVGVANTSIAVNTGTGDTYQVKIYDENPIGYKGTLKLYGEGRVADGNTLDMKISYPLAQAWAYVTLFDSQNYMSVYPTLIQDGLLEVNINNSQTKKTRRRAIQPSFQFPADADASKFLDDVPAGVEKLTSNQAIVNNYIDETWQGDLNIWGQGSAETNWQACGGTLYIKGNCNFSNRSFYFAGNSELYLVAGATLILGENNGSGNLQQNTKIYIAEGAKLVANGELKLNNGLHIYNHGTIEANKLSTNSNSLLVNGGTLTVDTHFSVENELSVIVNNGTITAASMNTAGSGKFQNNGSVTISGVSVINSNNNAWVNNGTYHTGYFDYNAGSSDVINNCRLIVDEDFNINLGDNPGDACFKMDASSSVVTKNFNGGNYSCTYYRPDWGSYETKNFQGGPFYIYMGAASLFEVTGTATMDATKPNYGIYGPETGDKAVFHAKKIVKAKQNQGFEVTYGGHLYVATDDHFALGYSDKSAEQQAAGEVGDQPYFRLDAASGAEMTPYNGANVTLSDEGCGAAYVGTPDEEEREETPMGFRFCFEDNFPDAGDYDFNDVVLTVTPTVNDKTLTIKVSLDAVGATKTLAAAIRLDGIKKTDLESCTVTQGFESPDGQGFGEYHNIESDETFLNENQSPNISNDMVIVLFKDAHWAINPVKSSTGTVERTFYNTVKLGDYYERDVDVKTATYTLVFKDANKANQMLAENLYDVFIVEPYNGSYWEVHTVENGFKTKQVITPNKPDGSAYAEAYKSNMPWAIKVPGDFKYPYEWQVIGWNKGGENKGAYNEPGHSFAEWAENSNNATDWYKYPTSGLVYE